ncbi:MAG: sulfurtransferase TusC, partial [Gammaproteobacteria bacterium]|nr:sulfurtransferase TusC [Gammaproteobacteria bacterium]
VYEDEDDDWEEKSSIHLVSREQLSDVIESADVLLNF